MEVSSRKSTRFKHNRGDPAATRVVTVEAEGLAEAIIGTGEKNEEVSFGVSHNILDNLNYNNSTIITKMTNKAKTSFKQPKKRNIDVIEMEDEEVTITRNNRQSSTNVLTAEETLACRHCKRKFSQGLVLLKHERRCQANSSVESEQYACDICLKFTFKTLAEWTEHRQLHFEGSRFKCPRCEKIFTAIAGVENHLPYCRGRGERERERQEQNKPSSAAAVKSKCMFCQKIPNTDITSHIMSNHSQSVMILCVCGKLSMGQRLHKEHLSSCRPSVNIIYACELCDTFISSSKNELFDHKRNYHGPPGQNVSIRNSSNLNSNPNQAVGTMNLSVNVINSLMGTASTAEVGPQNLLPSLLQLSDPALITIPSTPDLVPGPSILISKDANNKRPTSKPKFTLSRPPQLTQKPGMSGNRNDNSLNPSNTASKSVMINSKPTLTPPPLVKIPGKNASKFSRCMKKGSKDFREHECSSCGKKFCFKAALDLHTVQCDGKLVFKSHEYNIQDKDCAFLLALN